MDRRNFLKATLAVAGTTIALPSHPALAPIVYGGPARVKALAPDDSLVQEWVLEPHQIVHRVGDARPRLVGRLHFAAEESCLINRIVLWRAGKEFTLWERGPIWMVAGDTLTVEE